MQFIIELVRNCIHLGNCIPQNLCLTSAHSVLLLKCENIIKNNIIYKYIWCTITYTCYTHWLACVSTLICLSVYLMYTDLHVRIIIHNLTCLWSMQYAWYAAQSAVCFLGTSRSNNIDRQYKYKRLVTTLRIII